MTRKLKLVLAAALVSGLAACMDNGVGPLAVGPTTPPLSGFSAAVTCQVTVSTATLACGRATPVATNGIVHKTSGIELDVVTLGRQGSYVLLTSSDDRRRGVLLGRQHLQPARQGRYADQHHDAGPSVVSPGASSDTRKAPASRAQRSMARSR